MRAKGTRAEYYDSVHYSDSEVASRAHRKLSVADPWYRLVLSFFDEHGVRLEGARALEVGCGLGGFSQALASAGADVIGVDFSQRAVDAARRLARDNPSHGETLRFSVGDATNLDFDDGSFDVVVCCETLEHTFALRPCMAELARVCAPGGVVAVTVPNSLLGLPVDLVVSALGVGQPQRPVNYVTVRRAAASAGLTVVQAYGTNFCRNMFSEDVLPPVYRRVTERLGRPVERWMSPRNPLWVPLAGTVGFLLRRPASPTAAAPRSPRSVER